MEKLPGAVGKDFLRSCIVYFGAVAVVVPLMGVFIFLPMYLVQEGVLPEWGMIVAGALFLVVLLGGGFGGAWWWIARRNRWLDETFSSLGLKGRAYLISWRQFQGTVLGRQVGARFYRGPALELTVSTSVQTRFSAAERSASGAQIAGWLGRTPLATNDPALAGLFLYAMDETWGRQLCSDPGARAALLRLLQAGQDWALFTQVHLSPGQWMLRLYRNKNLWRFSATPDEARQWLADLQRLAAAGEALPAPQKTAELSGVERFARQGANSRVVWITVIVTLGLILGCGVVAAALGILLAAQ